MIEEQTKIITDYISVWGWQILSWLFFLKALGFLFVELFPIAFVLACLFVGCQIVTIIKKWRLEKEYGEGTK